MSYYLLKKSHVKEHTVTNTSGTTFTVKEHEDARAHHELQRNRYQGLAHAQGRLNTRAGAMRELQYNDEAMYHHIEANKHTEAIKAATPKPHRTTQEMIDHHMNQSAIHSRLASQASAKNDNDGWRHHTEQSDRHADKADRYDSRLPEAEPKMWDEYGHMVIVPDPIKKSHTLNVAYIIKKAGK